MGFTLLIHYRLNIVMQWKLQTKRLRKRFDDVNLEYNKENCTLITVGL